MRRLLFHVSTDAATDTINRWLSLLYGVVVLAISVRVGLSFPVVSIALALLLVHVGAKRLSRRDMPVRYLAHAAPRPTLAELEFSEREVEIARYIVQGLNAREIAEQTILSLGTVKNYTSSIYAKLGVTDRSKAIVALREILGV
jgi:DNA-binding NarL/FixJ family response regulator